MLKLQGEIVKKEEKLTKPQPKITFVQKVIKGETYMVMAQSQIELEDEFSNLYYTAMAESNIFLQPPFEPNVLLNFVQTNNVLNQCVEAMEVNIDGTGYEFVAAEEGGDINPEEEKRAEAFFNEPYPNLSFVNIRRKLRRELESVGYAYLEVLRNLNGDIVALRNMETHHIRMVKLDEAIQVKKKITRDGKDVELTMWDRERRFAQRVSQKQNIYYREYGSTRQLHRELGTWEGKEKIPPDKQATELIMFGVHPDHQTAYCLPRWINQLPSVVGSRNAEEQNLQFLDAGGMPPAIVFIQGGTTSKDAADQLRMYLSGQNKTKNRAVVVEVQSSSGSLDAAAKVDVKVERFGAEQAKDSMYQKYDESTEEHVRVGFRLPPLFLGKAADYNFATAQTAYMVAEAQVFLPERTEFDEKMNKTIIKDMGFKTLKLRSKPITLKDVTNQLAGLELSKDVASRDSYLKNLNTTTGMTLEMGQLAHPNVATDQEHPGVPTVAEVPHEQLPASTRPAQPSSPQPQPQPPKADPLQMAMNKAKLEHQQLKNQQMKQKKTAIELIELAHDFAATVGLIKKEELSPERTLVVKREVEDLAGDDLRAFNSLLASYTFGKDDPDLVSIAGHCAEHHLN